MKIIITDTGESPVTVTDDDVVIRKISTAEPCRSCFACWMKTPGICVCDDELTDFGSYLARSDEVILVSKMTYGSCSAFVQKALERALPYLLPVFRIGKGVMRPKKRYKNQLKLSAYFYGDDISIEEKETAGRLMETLAQDLGGQLMNVIFLREAAEVGGGL